jgi:hypothetical protein
MSTLPMPSGWLWSEEQPAAVTAIAVKMSRIDWVNLAGGISLLLLCLVCSHNKQTSGIAVLPQSVLEDQLPNEQIGSSHDGAANAQVIVPFAGLDS